ncbi:Nucleoporin [Venturia nashicola]|uniref:Nucleoporin n=1 Tax=Venturia nashicola TaxID=86259 RepID=A0A4Z1NEN3_9PEZI|nr:Nucleoporin [Venturia nashicola]
MGIARDKAPNLSNGTSSRVGSSRLQFLRDCILPRYGLDIHLLIPIAMPICKFYQNGTCRNGDRCRFDHVKNDNGRNPPGQDRYNQQSRNPFTSNIHQPVPGGHNNQSQGHGQRPGRTPNYGNGPRAGRFFIDEGETRDDLINWRPEWRLSCYTGTGQGCTDSPKHLMGGELEQSPEEMRVRWCVARDNDTLPQYQDLEQAAFRESDLHVTAILNDLKGAIKFAVNGKREDKNRWEVVDEQNKQTPIRDRGVFARDARPRSRGVPGGGFGAPAAPSTFGQAPTPSPFGQPSAPKTFGPPSGPVAFGQTSAPTPFGQPSAAAAFGQSSAPAAFGQPSAPSPFGQPSSLGQPSPFGQPSVSAQSPGFGQPSQLGQPTAFGAPSTGFGAPSALGQNITPFGQPSLLGQTSAFGKPPNPAQNAFSANKPAFGNPIPFGQASATASPFGQTSSQLASGAIPFGQPSAPAQANPFGAPASSPSPFGQPSAPQQNPSPFGQPHQQASAFGQPAQPQVTPFGQPSQPSQPPAQSAFGQPAQLPSTFGHPTSSLRQLSAPATSYNQPPPPTNSFAETSPQQAFNGIGASRPTTSSLNTTQPPARSSGPVSVATQDSSAPPQPEDPPEEMFEGNKAAFEEAYRWVREHGNFKDGIMPEIAPMHYWVGWGADEMKFKN